MNPRSPVDHLPAVLAYSLLSALTLWNAIQAPFTKVVGVEHLHVWEELWHFWWTKTALLTGRSPFYCAQLGFPDGMNVFHDMSSLSLPLVSVPLQALLGVVGAYNAIALCALTAAGFGAYLLCHAVTGHRLASFLGGIVFGFSPFLQTELSNGMMESLFAFACLPYFVLVLLRMHHGRRWRDGLVAGLIAGFASLSSWYFMVTAAFLTAWFLLTALREPDRPSAADSRACSDAGAAGPSRVRAFVAQRKRLLLAYAVLAATLTLLLIVPLTLLAAGPTLERGIPWRDSVRGPLQHKSCIDVLKLFTHGAASATAWPGASGGDQALELLPFGVYIGKITLLLVLLAMRVPPTPHSALPRPQAGAAAGGRSRAAGGLRQPAFWALGFFLFVLLMLGPYLNINGRVDWGGHRIPLPNRLLLLVPGTGRVAALHNYRFAACVMLFAAVLSALALHRLLSALPARLRAGLAVATAWLLLVDFGQSTARAHLLFLPAAPAALPRVFDTLSGLPPGAVFNIPVSSGANARPDIRGIQMYHQLAHGRPIPCDPIYEIDPPDAERALTRAARRMALRLDGRLPTDVLARDLEWLMEHGFRFVVVYKSFLTASDSRRINEQLHTVLGPPWAEDPGITLYRLRLK